MTKTEVSSVSRRNQNLSNVPAAAFVINAEDIRRSGALALPDVLRMVPGLQVAQIDSARYAVTSRGFNGRFANKLQVLIDGRSIYNPFFSGLPWEFDPIPLEDIERIEVIRGAGTAMWGVNAVNGVINIISRHSRQQGRGMAAATVGSQGEGLLYLRGGGGEDADLSWKLSAQGRYTEPSTQSASNAKSEDRLNSATVDFRLDNSLGMGSDLSLWLNASRSTVGDLYPLEISPTPPYRLDGVSVQQEITSQSLGGRYRWLSDSGIESSLQGSVNIGSVGIQKYFDIRYSQYDIDYQGRYTSGRHDLLWGLSHRTVADEAEVSRTLQNYQLFTISRAEFTQHTSGVFLHDDWTLVQDKLRLGVGIRWDNSNLGGDSFSPNATLMWTPSRSQTLWAKYSRAPRIPARAEHDVSLYSNYVPPNPAIPLAAPLTPGFPPVLNLATITRARPGPAALQQETMEGVELGFRRQFSPSLSIDASIYRYRYSDIVSSELGAVHIESLVIGGVVVPFYVQDLNRNNGANGWLNGLELNLDWLVLPNWRLQFSYTWTQIDMDRSDSVVTQAQGISFEKSTPRHVGSLRSQWNLSSAQQLDAWLRGSSGIDRTLLPYTTETRVPGYLTLDLRYALKLTRELELALTGRNLVGPRRIEYVTDYVPATPVLIEPSVLLSARWKF